MEAKITGFKGGRRTAYTDHPIIECTEGKSSELIGKKIFWKTATGKTISGRIVQPHGKTAYLTRFVRNLPGNTVGDTIIFGSPAQKIKQKPKKAKAKLVTPKKAEKKEVKPKKTVTKKAKTATPKKPVKKKSPPKKAAVKKTKTVTPKKAAEKKTKTVKKTTKKAPSKAKKTTKPAKKAKSKK